MIHVNVETHKNHIRKLKITGHAGYDKSGFDIVCAGVSSIGFGLCNALDILYPNANCKISENCILIEVEDTNEISDTILKTAIIQLETIEESYKKNVKIYKQEV